MKQTSAEDYEKYWGKLSNSYALSRENTLV